MRQTGRLGAQRSRHGADRGARQRRRVGRLSRRAAVTRIRLRPASTPSRSRNKSPSRWPTSRMGPVSHLRQRRRDGARGRRSRPTWPRVPRAWPKSKTRMSAATAIRSRIARTAARAGRSSSGCPTTGREPRWPALPCAPSAGPNTRTRPTAASTPSRSPVRIAGRCLQLLDRQGGEMAVGQAALERRHRGPTGRPHRGPQGLGRLSTARGCDQCRGRRSAPPAKAAAGSALCPDAAIGGRRAAVLPIWPTKKRECSRRIKRRSSYCAAGCVASGVSVVPDNRRRRRPGQSVSGRHAALYAAAPSAHGGRRAADRLHQRQPFRGTDGDYHRGRPARLGPIADVLLTHNRPIVRPVDDSIVRLAPDGMQVLRRGRGFAPLPIDLRWPKPGAPTDSGVGGHLKNTVALFLGGRAGRAGSSADPTQVVMSLTWATWIAAGRGGVSAGGR